MIYIGEELITDIMLGDSQISGVYAGELQIYPVNNNKFITFHCQNGDNGIKLAESGRTLQYSYDGETWTNWVNQETYVLNFGTSYGDLYLRGINSKINTQIIFISDTDLVDVYGNAMMLVDYTQNIKNISDTHCFDSLFWNCIALRSIDEKFLPATTLATSCYYDMFKGCTNLTNAPKLPAKVMASSCYNSMFYGCSSLETAPKLPAMTLANYCYERMFWGCSSLVNAPSVLPATTLAKSCYSLMFAFCSSLETAPELPAPTLVDYCYSEMFNGCTNLNYIKCLAIDRTATSCVDSWVNSVPTTDGTFVKAVNATWTRGSSGVPNGWTILDDCDLYPVYEHLGNTNDVGLQKDGFYLFDSTATTINDCDYDFTGIKYLCERNDSGGFGRTPAIALTLYDNWNLPSLTSITIDCTGFDGIFMLNARETVLPNLKSATFKNTDSITILKGIFSYVHSLESVHFGNLSNFIPEVDSEDHWARCFWGNNYTGLTDFSVEAWPDRNIHIGFPKLTALTVTSLVNILNALPTTTRTGAYITLGQVNIDKLTSEQLAIATDKGWQVRA